MLKNKFKYRERQILCIRLKLRTVLDIRNFGAKSIDEVKAKLHGMSLALKDSPPGFDPSLVVDSFGADDDMSFAEDEQL
jgi:DNA-directed RNA polymerase subunit alpha